MSCIQKQMSLISQWPWIKSHTVQTENQKFHEHLIMGVTSSGVDALSTPLSHAVYQSLKKTKKKLWYRLPLCHKHTGHMCKIGVWGMVTSKSTSQLVPCMLNRVQIWRIRWPIHPVDIVVPKKVCNNSCTMRSGVVILKHGRRINTLERRCDKGLDNLLQIAISVQVTINDIKRSPIIARKGTPNHDTANTKRQTLIDVNASKSLSRTPVDPFPAVTKL